MCFFLFAVLGAWETWDDIVPKEEIATTNKQWATETLQHFYPNHRPNAPGYVCEVLNKHVEFVIEKSAAQPTCFEYEMPNFQEGIKKFLSNLRGN